MPTSRLGQLQYLFEHTGFKGNPVISDEELAELYAGLIQLSAFMDDRGDRSMSNTLRSEAQSVYRMIQGRQDLK